MQDVNAILISHGLFSISINFFCDVKYYNNKEFSLIKKADRIYTLSAFLFSLKIDLQFFNYKFVAAMFESLYKALIHVLKYDSRNHLTKFVLLSYEITLLSNNVVFFPFFVYVLLSYEITPLCQVLDTYFFQISNPFSTSILTATPDFSRDY